MKITTILATVLGSLFLLGSLSGQALAHGPKNMPSKGEGGHRHNLGSVFPNLDIDYKKCVKMGFRPNTDTTKVDFFVRWHGHDPRCPDSLDVKAHVTTTDGVTVTTGTVKKAGAELPAGTYEKTKVKNFGIDEATPTP